MCYTLSYIYSYFCFSDDHSRVVLSGNEDSDYINASYIDVSLVSLLIYYNSLKLFALLLCSSLMLKAMGKVGIMFSNVSVYQRVLPALTHLY